ncbi:hypothetical protein ABZ820_33550 [Streptomyces diacarni]|uniref:hypothetical protein n=1 Tax=Streptomyces diacarni TaxID=2800381 RepID=UPI0033CFD5DA
MRPKLLSLLAISAVALVGCSAPENPASNEQAYLNAVHDSLKPIAEHVSEVTDDNLLSAARKACDGENVPRFDESGIYHFALSNVIITSASVLCPESQSYVTTR